MNITGIYHIKNIINGKVYPGSAENVEKRWRQHKNALKRNEHHSSHLQRAWLKYGEENFVFLIIEECEPIKKILLEREQVHLDAVRIRNPDGTLGDIDHNLAYNMYPIAGSSLGMKHSEETKKKISGENHPMYGKHHSEESRKKMSESHIGENNHNFGKHLSEEHKKKLSEAQSGEKSAWFGKHHSEETKRKLSEAKSGENNPMFGLGGEKSYKAILTWEKVREIRERYAAGGISRQKLAVEYGVTKSCIQHIIKNRTWKEETEN